MTKGVYSVRLDGELAHWIDQQITKHKRGSDVIREAIITAMSLEKKQNTKTNLLNEAAEKSIISYRILEALVSTSSPEAKQILEHGNANGAKDIHKILNYEEVFEEA